MFGLSGRGSEVRYGALIDVGSGSAGVAILRSDSGKKLPHILFSHRVPMRVSGDNKERRMREALFSASLILSKDGLIKLKEQDKKARVSRILVTSSAPWARTISRETIFENETDEKISQSLIEKLIEQAENGIADEVVQIPASTSELMVVERATVDLKLNGYATEHPLGQIASELSLSHIVGMLPKEIIEAATEVQEKIFPDTSMSAHTFLLVMYCVLRDLLPKMHSFTLVDITGEATEVGVVEHDILRTSAHADIGYHTLARKLSVGSDQDGLSMLRALCEKATTEDECAKSVVVDEYAHALSEVLSGLHTKRQLPQKIIVTVPVDYYELFADVVRRVAADVTDSACTIIKMQGKMMNEIAEGENQDVYLSITSRFFHKLHSCGEMDIQQ